MSRHSLIVAHRWTALERQIFKCIKTNNLLICFSKSTTFETISSTWNLCKIFLFRLFRASSCFLFYRYFVIVTLLATVNCVSRTTNAKDKFKLNCAIRHLKFLNMLELDFPEQDAGSEQGDCVKLIKEASDAVFVNPGTKLPQKEFQKYKQCMTTNLKARRWPEFNMKLAIFVTSSYLSQNETQQRVNEIKKQSKKLVQNAVKLCVFSEIFEELFMDSSSEDDDSKATKYCVRKHVVENNYIDQKIYVVDLNPTNFNVSMIDCGEHLERQTSKIRNELDGKISDCAKEKILKEEYVNKIMAFEVLSDLNITEVQKEAERRNFIDLMVQLIKAAGDCRR